MPTHANKEILKLPDQLLVRYFRDGEIDAVSSVQAASGVVTVNLKVAKTKRVDVWRDLGGGLGYVPEAV